MIDAPDTWIETALRLGAAVLMGGALGWDRERSGRPAGLRTHMMVAMGAAAFTVVALIMIEDMAPMENTVSFDPMRIVGGIIGGIGFLGAGAIIQSGGRVQGLTTAAGLWACAAIGLATGVGLYTVAALVTGFGLLILVVLKSAERAFMGDDKAARQSLDGDKDAD